MPQKQSPSSEPEIPEMMISDDAQKPIEFIINLVGF